MKPLHVTEVLMLAGLVDYSWCTDEAKFRGSEVHRAINLRIRGRIKKRNCEAVIAGCLTAYDRFRNECHFLATQTEVKLYDPRINVIGRADAFGRVQKRDAIVDFKTGEIVPATAIQLALYGYMHTPDRWWLRHAVKLNADGTYRVKTYLPGDWYRDLSTALAAVRVAQWRVANGLARL